jgi:hypothetical protein
MGMSASMSKSRMALVTLLLVVCGLTAAASTGSAGTVGWVATHTQALNLTSTSLGSAPAGQQLVVSAALPLRNTDEIASTIASGTILTPDQVSAQFGPTADQVQAVENYFTANGFTDVSASRPGLLVTGTATVAQADRAFDTSISNYELSG